MPIAPNDFDYIRELVRSKSGIVLETGKEYLVESRITPLMRMEGIAGGYPELIARLAAQPGSPLHRKVVEAMTTNETSFFRDIHPFTVLKESVIPDVIRKRETMGRTLSLWCAAASSGQEPYTIAMVLRESFPQLFTGGWRLNFISTDISSEMIRRCKDGCFSQIEVNRGLPATLMVKYFKRRGVEWQIDEQLRSMIDFRELNLCEDWQGLANIDIVFMRNVLIYFSLDVKKQILAKVRRVLRPDGYLFLGGAETTINIDEAYDRAPFQRGGVYIPRKAGSPSAKAA